MKRKLMLIGGGGHCHSVIDSAIKMDEFDELGIVDDQGNSCFGVPIIGTDDDIPKLIMEGWNEAFITVGSVGDTSLRRKLFRMVKEYNLSIPAIIDPSSITAKGIDFQEGTYIGKKAVVNTGVSLGVCTIVNSGAIVEHDCKVGDFVHVSPGATICGQVTIGNDTHIGAGSVIIQMVNVGEGSVIGAGSVVVKDIPSKIKAYGNPCRVV